MAQKHVERRGFAEMPMLYDQRASISSGLSASEGFKYREARVGANRRTTTSGLHVTLAIATLLVQGCDQTSVTRSEG
jgi:hypothetical protein